MITNQEQIAQFFKDEVWDETFHIGVSGHQGKYSTFPPLHSIDLLSSQMASISVVEIEAILAYHQESWNNDDAHCHLIFKTHSQYYVFLCAHFDGFGNFMSNHSKNFFSTNLKSLWQSITEYDKEKFSDFALEVFIEKEQFEKNINFNEKVAPKQKI